MENRMQQRHHTTAFILISCLALFSPTSVVQAVPVLPSSIYGSVRVNNANVPDGTLVQAVIAGRVVAYGNTQTYQGGSVYSLDVPGDDPGSAVVEGGKEGDTIQIKVGGLMADQTGTWHSGTNVRLDLTVTTSATPIPPQATSTSVPSQTPFVIVATPNPSPTSTISQPDPSSTPSATSTTAAKTEILIPSLSAIDTKTPVSPSEAPILTATLALPGFVTPTDYPLPAPGTGESSTGQATTSFSWIILLSIGLIIVLPFGGWILHQQKRLKKGSH